MLNKTYVFHTLGCKLNFAETSSVGKQLQQMGFRKAKAGEEAGVCIVNTCSVTETADRKDRQAIHKIRREHPNAVLIVTGCYAQLKPGEVAAIDGVDLVLGMNEKFDIPAFLEKYGQNEAAQVYCSPIRQSDEFHGACSKDDRTRFFLKVQDGCDYFCTYCTVPLARGKSRNGTIASLVSEAENAIAGGAKEIVLSGVNIGDFGKTTGETFFDLVKALDAIQADVRYRISSIEPNLLTDEIIDYVASSAHFAPHFHIPLQSGSNDVLQLMKRRYTREVFAAKVAKIKAVMPHAFIGVDVIVGVRGETEDFFADACRFIESLDISQLHVFTYSERPNTEMLKIPYTVPPQEKKRRSDVLHALSARKTEQFYAAHKGYEATVLWESKKTGSVMHGFTENYIRVEAPYQKELVNTFQKIRVS